jgi:CheY-like chemotaxis protein
MSVLAKIDLMDAVSALQGFPVREDFWVALTKVCTDADRYLRDYTAAVVLFDTETRSDFFKELEDVRVLLESLHVKSTPTLLRHLSDAVMRTDESSLSDGLRVFYAEMDILRKTIAGALVHDKVSVRNAGKPVVMAVDDEPVILKTISECLVGSYRVIALNNGYSALNALDSQTPDLFLIDIMMPGMSGYQLVEKLRSIDKFLKTPIVFITGLESEKHILAGMKQGGNDFLRKPFSAQELIEKVREHLVD